MMKSHPCLSIVLTLFGFFLIVGGTCSPAQALTYDLTNVTFTDGATATGSFDIDSSSGFFPTNVNIITSTSPTFAGVNFYNSGGILNPSNVPNGYFYNNPIFPAYSLFFQLDASLSSLPTSANLFTSPNGFSLEEYCFGPQCSGGSGVRYISGGGVIAHSTGVPEPASLLLLSIGVAAAMVWRQRFSV